MVNYKEMGRSSFVKALKDSAVPFDTRGVNKTIGIWNQNKKHLITQLSKHPLWVPEELAIVGTIEETRENQASTARNYLQRLVYFVNISFEELNLGESLNYLYTTAGDMLSEKTISQSSVDAIGSVADTWRVKPTAGMKSSRFVLKTLEAFEVDMKKDESVRSIFTSYTEAISPYSKVLPYSLSANPGDFVLMSNGNSWSTCHTMTPGDDGPGQWAAGPLSYMMDKSSLVFSAIRDDNVFNKGEMFLVPKLYRQMFFIGDDGKTFIQSRLYPNYANRQEFYKEIRKEVHGILSTMFGFENQWASPKKNDERLILTADSHFYPDYTHYGVACRASVVLEKKEAYVQRELDGVIPVGVTPLCLDCGEHPVLEEDYVHCRYCNGNHLEYYGACENDDNYDW